MNYTNNRIMNVSKKRKNAKKNVKRQVKREIYLAAKIKTISCRLY